jgi:histidinol-phosphate/aromatic aminotransferase/cobyric acid decarboxylase-like protein
LANGACEVIQALLVSASGPVLLNLPTFSAYYEFANSAVQVNELDPRRDFRVDLDQLEQLVHRHRPHTVVIINPNNPDGGLIPYTDLVAWLERVHDRVPQIIVDESFSHFTTEDAPPTLAGLVEDMPHLVVVNSLSKNYGIAGLRLGYAVMSAPRARALRGNSLWNLNAFAEWFTTLLGDPVFQQAYERARLRYFRDIRTFFADLTTLPGITVHPSAANFALLRLNRPAEQVTGSLLARHGVYVRDCADKRGLTCGEQYVRVAARTRSENRCIVDSLRDVLNEPAEQRQRMVPSRSAAQSHC